MSAQNSPPLRIRRYVVFGVLALVILFGGFGGWATFAELSAATIARGRLSSGAHSRQIQHVSGGRIQTVSVSEGEFVARGATLLRLDDRKIQSEISALKTRIAEITTRHDRLIAERDGLSAINFSQQLLLAARTDPEITMAMNGQERLYSARQISWTQERQALNQRANQIGILTEGITAQINAYDQQKDLILAQLDDAQILFAKGLIAATNILALKREIAALSGRTGAAVSKRAESLAKVSEIELEILRIKSHRRETAIEQLRDLEFRHNELLNQHREARTRLAALTLHAPIDGVVLGLGNLASQTVIEPGQILMQIVPQEPDFAIETRISPTQIGKIYPGQIARLTFPAQLETSLLGLTGTVIHVAADTQTDAATGQPYFQVRINPSKDSGIRIENAADIVTGMPVEVFFDTGSQPAWRYLAKPILGYFSKALRES